MRLGGLGLRGHQGASPESALAEGTDNRLCCPQPSSKHGNTPEFAPGTAGRHFSKRLAVITINGTRYSMCASRRNSSGKYGIGRWSSRRSGPPAACSARSAPCPAPRRSIDSRSRANLRQGHHPVESSAHLEAHCLVQNTSLFIQHIKTPPIATRLPGSSWRR